MPTSWDSIRSSFAMPLPVLEPGTLDTSSTGGSGIRCPRCRWEPQKSDAWACTCGHLWNTFDTGGVCPGCLKQWLVTCCPNCGEWSPHSDWYPQD